MSLTFEGGGCLFFFGSKRHDFATLAVFFCALLWKTTGIGNTGTAQNFFTVMFVGKQKLLAVLVLGFG